MVVAAAMARLTGAAVVVALSLSGILAHATASRHVIAAWGTFWILIGFAIWIMRLIAHDDLKLRIG